LGSIIGIIDKQRNSIDPKLIVEPMKELQYWDPDNSRIWAHGNIVFGNHMLFSSPVSEMEDMPLYDRDSACCLTADCRIDYRDELALKLGIKEGVLDGLTDSQLILESYLKWGRDCLDHLYGDFVFSIWDSRNQELFCARDHFGCRPFYYYEDDRYFAFSSNILGLHAIPEISNSFDDQMLPRIASSWVFPENRTLYKNIRRLPACNYLLFRHSKKTILKNYWHLKRDLGLTKYSDEDIILKFKELLKKSIYERVKGKSNVGVELSGGLDSTSIAALLKTVKSPEMQVFSFTHCLSKKQRRDFFPFEDETDLSIEIANWAEIDSHFLLNETDKRGGLQALFDFMNASGNIAIQLFSEWSDLLLDKAAENDVNVLLSGFGGDECVSFHAKSIKNEYAIYLKWRKLWKVLIQEGGKVHDVAFRFFKVIVRSWIKYFIRNLQRRDCIKYSNFNLEDLAFRREEQERYWNEIIKHQKGWSYSSQVVSRQQIERLRAPHIADRLENSYHMALGRKMEYAYPMLDLKLIQFVYSIPVELKNCDGIDRCLIRTAMQGIMPDKVRLRDSKFAAAMPTVSLRLERNREEFARIIEDARTNNQYHYLDYDKLLHQLDELSQKNKGKKISFGPSIFISSISLLILQKWQREGKIDIGIKT